MKITKKVMRGRGAKKKEIIDDTKSHINETTVDTKNTRDTLATLLAAGINAQFKEFRAAWFLDGLEDERPGTEVTEWISTGDDILDLRISNRPHGGIPVGKITELNGLEGSGKSLILGHLIVETQKKGGVAVLIDTESATQKEFLEAIGVDTSSLLYLQLDAIEDVWTAVDKIIADIREKSRDRLVLICVDSIAGATTKVEEAEDYEKKGWNTTKALIMGIAMRKLPSIIGKQRIALVCTQQLRAKLNVMFGDPYTTSAGLALKFAASVRIRLTKVETLKMRTEAIGIKVKAKVEKNRVGPPLRSCELQVYFNRGIDRYANWIIAMKEFKIGDIGTTVTVGGETIALKTFQETMETNLELREKAYQMICDAAIMKYRGAEIPNMEEITISNEREE